jgi:putative protease
MKLTTYAGTLHELGVLKNLNYDEVILGPKTLSRFGTLTREDFISLSTRARELGLRVLLEWDILMTEDVFVSVLIHLKALLPYADAIRVQDPGALNWCLENTHHPIQFIAENGNHNLKALEGWVELSEKRLERIVLSLELSKDLLKNYIQHLTIPCELLGLGRILLFYTPRPLLSALAPEKVSQNELIMALGESEESPHKGFPILENHHGTFMFHIKEFCLIDFASELKAMGLGFLRIDQRFETPSQIKVISKLVEDFSVDQFDNFRSTYSQDLMRGFYLVNKTDVLFPKLKNSRLQQREGTFIGEVLEVEKGSHLAIMVKNPRGLKKTDQLRILHPKGEVIYAGIFSLKNLSDEHVEVVPSGEMALIQYIGGVWVKSQVFYHMIKE